MPDTTFAPSVHLEIPALPDELGTLISMVDSQKHIEQQGESEITPAIAIKRATIAVDALIHSGRPQYQFKIPKTTATRAILDESTFTALREALGYIDVEGKDLEKSPSNPIDYNALGTVLASICCDESLFKKLETMLMTIYRKNIKELATTAGGIRFITKILEIGDIRGSDVTILANEYLPLFAASEQGSWIIYHMIDRNFLQKKHKEKLLSLLPSLARTPSGKFVIGKMVIDRICSREEAEQLI